MQPAAKLRPQTDMLCDADNAWADMTPDGPMWQWWGPWLGRTRPSR